MNGATMITIEVFATVTSDRLMILKAPDNVSIGVHRVRLTVMEADLPPAVEHLSEPKLPTPKRFINGRPVYDDDDRRFMKPHLPPEDEWAKEDGVI